jgi:GNT-I family/Glycosyltransferase family 18
VVVVALMLVVVPLVCFNVYVLYDTGHGEPVSDPSEPIEQPDLPNVLSPRVKTALAKRSAQHFIQSTFQRGVHHSELPVSFRDYLQYVDTNRLPAIDAQVFAAFLFEHMKTNGMRVRTETVSAAAAAAAGPVISSLSASISESSSTSTSTPVSQQPSNNDIGASSTTSSGPDPNVVDMYNLQLQHAIASLELQKLTQLITSVREKGLRPQLLDAAVFIRNKLFSDQNSMFERDVGVEHSVATMREVANGVPAGPALPGTEIDIGTFKTPEMPVTSFPIGVVAYNRPDVLKSCLGSLLQLEGINIAGGQVTVYQDGTDAAVAATARSFPGVQLNQQVRTPEDALKEGAQRIAEHYKHTLSHLFDSNPDAKYVIVVEDDMVFAPDFLKYFARLAHLYEVDDSIYCISSWNDNGQQSLVSDNRQLYRTEFFVGLGWLVKRSLYKGEWEQQWPIMHWDHWLREPAQRKGRECVYPEISRNYNIGMIGTHSDKDMFDRYFKNIVLNDQADVDLGDVERLTAERYEWALVDLLRRARTVDSIRKLNDAKTEIIALYYEAVGPDDQIWETVIAPHFGLWHSVPFLRNVHRGLVQFKWNGNTVLLIASYSPYAIYKPRGTRALSMAAFGKSMQDLDSSVKLVIAERNQACTTACSRRSLTCSFKSFAYINNCDALEAHFKCKRCDKNLGTDQPAFVVDPDNGNYDLCLMNMGPFSCEGKHDATQRLCPCVAVTELAAPGAI